jgi:hypothetical protein
MIEPGDRAVSADHAELPFSPQSRSWTFRTNSARGVLITEETCRPLPKRRSVLDERPAVEPTGKQVQVHQWSPRTRQADASTRGHAGATVSD